MLELVERDLKLQDMVLLSRDGNKDVTIHLPHDAYMTELRTSHSLADCMRIFEEAIGAAREKYYNDLSQADIHLEQTDLASALLKVKYHMGRVIHFSIMDNEELVHMGISREIFQGIRGLNMRDERAVLRWLFQKETIKNIRFAIQRVLSIINREGMDKTKTRYILKGFSIPHESLTLRRYVQVESL